MNWKNEETPEFQLASLIVEHGVAVKSVELEKDLWTLFRTTVKHSQQQLLESLEEEVKKLETKEYLAGSPEYHRQRVLNKVKALIQIKKDEYGF